MPKVSIIVPNYNHASYLKERLDSIFTQTFQDFEVILLDDASTDESVRILKEYAKDKKVSHFIINKKNTGSPFKQWKKGLELAQGQLVWIAESDDTCNDNFLEAQVEVLKNYDITVAQTRILRDKIKLKDELNHQFHHNYKTQILLPKHFIHGCPIGNVSAVLFKKELILDIRKSNFNENKIIGDMFFYFEYFLNKKIYFNENTLSYFRQKESGLSNLESKGTSYYKEYLQEYGTLLLNILELDTSEIEVIKKSLLRRMNKIRNRLSKKDKISSNYLRILLKYNHFVSCINKKV